MLMGFSDEHVITIQCLKKKNTYSEAQHGRWSGIASQKSINILKGK